MFVDTHAHIYSEYYDDISDIIIKSNQIGVKTIINSGISNDTNQEILELSKKHSNMFVTLGIHPESVNDYTDEDIEYIKNHLKDEMVVAIGEIGLDYHYEEYDKQKQIVLFRRQLDIAHEYNLPVVIHSRDAVNDTLEILKDYKLKGIIHSFSGSYEVAQEYVKLGYKLGINGVVTFKNAHIKEVVKKLGIEHFVFETDSPYLTPVPLRGKQNYPGNIILIVDYLCDYLCVSKEELSKITNKNVMAIFDKICL